MTLYAPVFIDTSQADCSVLSAAALLLMAPIILPVAGVVYAVDRYKNYRRKKQAKKAIKAILQDAFDTNDDKDILAKWMHHDMTYVMLDGATYTTRHDVIKQICEHDGNVVIYIVDPFTVRLHHLYGGPPPYDEDMSRRHIRIYNMYDPKLYKNYENDVITLKDGYYGILGKKFTIEYIDDSPANQNSFTSQSIIRGIEIMLPSRCNT
jgi:hypothetical protein